MVSLPTRVGGDVEGERIVHVHGRGDCVLAVSGEVKQSWTALLVRVCSRAIIHQSQSA